MASSDGFRPDRGQEVLHRWAMWRMTVNQELIHGLERGQSSPHGLQTYQSFTDIYSETQKYIRNPTIQCQLELTYNIRNAYGMPPSPRNPIGHILYYLYGLPRVSSAVRVPEIISSPIGQILPDRPKPGAKAVQKRSHQQSYHSKPLSHTKRNSAKVDTAEMVDSYRHDNQDSQKVSNRIEKETKAVQSSPVNFRERPESDFLRMEVNNINKPVVVPPSVFQNEVLKRSNVQLPLNITNTSDDHGMTTDENEFEDPRLSRFNDRSRSYNWNDPGVVDIESDQRRRHKYVDESYMKTHM